MSAIEQRQRRDRVDHVDRRPASAGRTSASGAAMIPSGREMISPYSAGSTPSLAFSQVSCQMSDQLLGDPGPDHGCAPMTPWSRLLGRAPALSAAPRPRLFPRPGSRPAAGRTSPRRPPGRRRPRRRPARPGDSTAASSAARSESVPTVNVCPNGSAGTWPSGVSPGRPPRLGRRATQPRGRRSPSVTQIHGSPAGLRALATVASAREHRPGAQRRGPSRPKNDSRLMPRSKPTNPAT